MSERETVDGGRRRFLTNGAAMGGALGLAALFPAMVQARTGERSLRFVNTHTGERSGTTFWENGRYLPDGLAEANRILRDWRTDEQHPIDPALLDLLVGLRGLVGADGKEIGIISGYRSPRTNAMLHEASSKVATRSLHQVGKAIDIRIPGVGLDRLRNTALMMQRGGVGFYPAQDFVHVDTGRVRFW